MANRKARRAMAVTKLGFSKVCDLTNTRGTSETTCLASTVGCFSHSTHARAAHVATSSNQLRIGLVDSLRLVPGSPTNTVKAHCCALERGGVVSCCIVTSTTPPCTLSCAQHLEHLTCPIVHVAYYYSSFMCNIIPNIPVWHLSCTAYLLFLRGYLVGRPHTLLNVSIRIYFSYSAMYATFSTTNIGLVYITCVRLIQFSLLQLKERKYECLVTYLRGTHWHYCEQALQASRPSCLTRLIFPDRCRHSYNEILNYEQR